MSTTIDEKVVEMRFDNKDFEKNVKTSMNTLDGLKKSLDFKDANKSLDSLEKSAKKVKFAGLGEAVDTVKQRFSALEIIGVTALMNIANSAVETGKRVLKSLTVEPIKQGFDEYELKMGSVQTIMASTGADIKTVNGYLDELNTYADKTIYSFSDMTASIGKFTNAGVSLDNAVKAIQGISNEAAVSGANAQEASRAMYNFAQALSAGSVKLIDWKSIENANMATVEFKQSLLDTAVAMGTVVKVGDDYKSTTVDNNGHTSELFNTTKGFNDALSSQWMTTEVLVQTLSNYSTDIREMSKEEKKAYEEKLKSIGYTEEQIQSIEKLGQKAFDAAQDVKSFSQLMDTLKEGVGSGWSQTFEIIFGDLEEAKKLWSSVYKELGGIIDASSTARNDLLSAWDAMGGRKELLQAFANVWKNIKNILGAVRDGFRDVFPPMTAKRLIEFTKNFKKLTETLMASGGVLEKIRSITRNVFKIFSGLISIAKQMFSALINGIKQMTGAFVFMGNGVDSVTGKIAEWVTNLAEWLKTNDVFNKIVNKTIQIIKELINAIKRLNSGFSRAADPSSGLESFGDKLKKIFKPLGAVVNFIKSVFSALIGVLRSLWPPIKKIFSDVAETLSGVKDRILEIMKNATSKDIMNFAAGGGILFIVKKFGDFLKKLTESVKDGSDELGGIRGIFSNVKDLIASVTGIFDGLKGTLESFQKSIKANIILKIAIAIAVLTAALVVLSGIDKGALEEALTVVTAEFVELIASMKILTAGDSLTSSTSRIGTMLIEIAASIYIIASAMKKVSAIDRNQLENGIGAITVLITELTASMKILSTGSSSLTGSKTLISMAAALYIIAGAVRKLSKIDTGKTMASVTAISVIIVELTAFTKIASGSKLNKVGVGLVLMARAVSIMASAMKKLGELGMDSVIVGITGFTTIMTLMTTSMVVLSKNSKGLLKVASSLVVFSLAVTILAAAFKIFASGDLDKTVNGIVAFAGSMGILIVSMKLLQTNTKGMVKTVSSILLFSLAMTVLGAAFKIFTSMDMDSVTSGLLAFGGVMGIIVTSLTALVGINKYAKGITKVSATLIVFSVAMTIIAGAMVKIGQLDTNAVSTAIIGLGSAIAIMVVAATKLAMIDLEKLSSIGWAMFLFSDAFTYIADAIETIGKLDPKDVAIGLVAFAGAFVIMIKSIQALDSIQSVPKIAAGILVLSFALIALATAMKIFGSMGLLSIIGSLTMLAGTFVVIGVAAKVLNAAVPAIFKLARAIILLGVGITAIGVGMFLLATALVTIAATAGAALVSLVALVKGLIGLLPYFAETFVEMLKVGIAALRKILPEVFDFIIEFLAGVLKTIRKLVPDMVDTIGSVILSVLKGIVKYAPKILSKIMELLISLIEAIGNYAPKLADAAVKAIFKVLKGIGDALVNNIELIRDAMFGLIIDVLESALTLVVPWLMKWITGNHDVAESIEVLTEEQQANIQKSMEMAKAYRDLRDARNESFKDISSEYQYIEDLKNEYNSLIDDNGKIKTGYEERANTIKTTLADAMGVELSEIDKLIDANGRLGKSFDEVIQKMQAEALLEANKDAYQTAVKNRDEAIRQYASAGRTLAEVQKQLDDANAKEAAIMDTYNNMLVQDADAAKKYLESQQGFFDYHDKLKVEVGNAAIAYRNAAEAYSGTMQEISNTQTLMAAVSSGNAEDIKKAMELLEHSFITAENGTKETLKQQIRDYEGYYNDLKDALDRGENGVTDEMVLAAQSRLSKAKGELAKFEQAHYESGKKADNKQAEGIKENSGVVSGAAVAVISSAKAAADKEAEKFKSTGENVGAGTAQGIIDSIKGVGDAVKAMMKSAKKTADKELDSHSPSKEFEKRGGYIGQGLVNGIEACSSEVGKATANLAETSIKSAEKALSYIEEYLNSDITYEPKIKPVVDLSNVNDSAGVVDGLFNNSKTMDLAAETSFATSMAKASRDMTTVNGKTVTSSIDLLHKDIQSLESKMASLKIFMDTGALVGQLVDPMDTAIGNKAYLVERGV